MLPYINYPFEKLSAASGAGVDELKLIGVFLLSYPLAGILKRIPDSKPELKNVFSICVTLTFLIGLFDLWSGVRTILISSSAIYALAWRFPHESLMPWAGFTFLMLHMSVGHIYRQFINPPDAFDITGAQMVLVMKLSAFCWNIRDGQLPDNSDLASFQRERRLISLPSLLDYAGYVLFFPSFFAGPAFDYIDYKNWLSTSMFDAPAGTPAAALPPTRKKRRIPRSGTPAAIKGVTGLAWIFLFLQFSKRYTADLLLSSEYMHYSLPRRIWLLHAFGFTTRLKYYGVWTLTEGACILSGLGYAGINPSTGRYTWDRLQNVAPLALETAQNTRGYLEAWNQNTNHWLKNYVYLRVTPKGQKPGFRASMATFVTSAFWHGFYPGYYLAFVLAAFLQTVAKQYRRQIRPLVLPAPQGLGSMRAKQFYDALSWAVTQAAFSFTVSAFILLDLRRCLVVWTRVYWYCPVGVAVSMGAFATPVVQKYLRAKGRAIQQLQSQQKEGEGAGLVKTASGASSIGGHGALGVPGDPSGDVDEVVREARERLEGEIRRRREKQGVVGREK